jgi:aldose 1-epimerase
MPIEFTASLEKELFGKLPDRTEVFAFTLSNQNGMRVKIINYGASIAECWVPDRDGKPANVVLGFDNLEQYLAKHPRFGATIGRYANRISNAQFEIDGTVYKLARTKGSTSTHGGVIGFDKKVWIVKETGENETDIWLTLSYLSVDMEEGFPGNLNTEIKFQLSKHSNDLLISYQEQSDKKTPVNLTNHSYFNLKGAGCGNILDHIARFNASAYTPLNEEMVPTGEIASVKDSPYDFVTKSRRIGDRVEQIGGYDINYVIDKRPGEIESLGTVSDPESGRALTVYTDLPCFQFFTANSLDGSISGNGGAYPQYGGFCLETQVHPNAVNQHNFANSILDPNVLSQQLTRFSFSTLPAAAEFDD